MGLTVRQFIESLSTHGVVSTTELATLRDSIAADESDADAEKLAVRLVQQGKLTKFQAANLYQGRGKGLVFGEYVVLDKIGAGGMGQVYKAQHRRMKRIVALKVLPPQAVNSAKAVQRFYQEVEVAAKLTHPNIVTAYDAGESHGMHFLVMEYVDGKDLASYVNKQGPLQLEQALNVVLQAARGLAYAHGLGIVHRDVKPSNLLVDRSGTVKVLDMGLARIDNPLADGGAPGQELTASGEVMGTVDYMAPEQAQDTRAADHRADIYALGCTLYRLLTGKPVYGGDTAVQKILAHRDRPIPSLCAVRGDVPDVVDKLFQKMLAKNVAERTQSMAQVVSSLERLLAGVGEERSSVVVGAEPSDEEAMGGALGSSLLTGIPAVGAAPGAAGSSIGSPGSSGGSSGSALGGSQVGRNSSQGATSGVKLAGQSTIGGERHTAPPIIVTTPTSSATAKVVKAKRAEAPPTDADRALPPKLPAPRSKKPPTLLVGAVAAGVVVVGVAVYLLTRSGPAEEPPIASADPSPTAAVATPAAGDVATTSDVPAASPAASVVAASTVPNAVALPAKPATTVSSVPEDKMKSAAATPDFLASATTAPPAAPMPQPSPTSAAPPKPAAPLTAEVDLLALVEPEKTANMGEWTREGSDVVCKKAFAGSSRVLVPYAPPEEYDLTCVGTVTAASGSSFGLGLVIGKQQAVFVAAFGQCGISSVEGRPWHNGDNPTLYHGRLFDVNQPATVVCAVRKDRLSIEVNGKRAVYLPDRLERLALDADYRVSPGQLFLCGGETRISRLTIGPPKLKVPGAPSAVNLAAAFDPTRDVVEGEASRRRHEIVVRAEPGKAAKLAFDPLRTDGYRLTAVVERTAGEGYLCLGLPVGFRRVGVIIDWTNEKVVGLHWIGNGGANINSTGRRLGVLIAPGAYHVIEAVVTPDPKGYRVEVDIDGRRIVDYRGNDFADNGESRVPEPRALSLAAYSSGWRMARLDFMPASPGRLPPPTSEAKLAAGAAVRSLAAQATAKNATLDVKLIAVDQLRREAAVKLDEPTFRYAALEEALRIAVEAGDLSGAYESAEDLCAAFEVDDRALEQRVVDAFKVPRSQSAAKQQLIDEALRLADRAAKSRRFEWAADLNAALDKFVGTSNSDLKRELRARSVEYNLAKTLHAALPKSAADAAAADDAAAHTVRGRYLCFTVGDWSAGVKELAQGDDAALKAAADLELGDVKTADAQAAVGDKWWELYEKEKDNALKWAYLERAASWYDRAAPKATGRAKAAIDRRSTLLAQQRKVSNGAFGPRRPLDAVKIGDHWYKFVPMGLTWQMAAETCHRMGGSLLTIESPAEEKAVAQYLLTAAKQENVGTWLGISDEETEGRFVDLDGRSIVSPAYANWSGGEPNNAGGVEDFGWLEVVFQDGAVKSQWRDSQPQNPAPFICEWDR